MEKTLLYQLDISEGDTPEGSMLSLKKYDGMVYEEVLIVTGEEAQIWLEFFVCLKEGESKILAERK